MKEIDFQQGDLVTLTTDDQYKEKCDNKFIWLDYKNITKVLPVGNRIFIDDGLLSIKAQEVRKLLLPITFAF